MRVLILGSGPAGMMAAHGVLGADRHAKVEIVSRPGKSTMYGAQYLHQPIPGINDPDDFVEVRYILNGTVDQYRYKVYGQTYDGTTSPEDLTENHRAWNISETYDVLWELYNNLIFTGEMHPHDVTAAHDAKVYDYIFNTIPMDSLCPRGHQFRYQEIKAAGSAPDRGIDIPYNCEPNTVICNGEDSPSWYRLSNIFDRKTVEWPMSVNPPFHAATVRKPLDNNCDCFPFMIRLGRYGSWTKGVLSHQAYEVAFDTISQHGSAS